jgi:hypothetical protein
MRSLLLVLVLAFVASAEPPSDAAIDRLIGQLGDTKYSTRDAATKSLLEIGEPALERLRKARTSTDAEVRRRSAQLVRQIEQRVEMAQLLAPSRVRLVLKETPLPDAVAELARKANVKIELKGDRAELAKKKVTLDTGDVSFWQAFDQLCRKVNLTEEPPPPDKSKPRSGVTGSIVIIGGAGMGRVAARDILKLPAEEEPKAIVLREGKPTDLPAALAGNVRVRILPADAYLPGKPRGENELLIGLEAKVEPRMVWKGVVGLRVSKALDDQGRQLADITILPKPEAEPNRGGGVVVINQVRIDGSRPEPGLTGPIPLRLRKGTGTSKSLKELSGALIGVMQTAHEPLVAIDDILKAAGKSVKGEKAGVVKVVEVSNKDGEVKMRLHVESPAASFDDGPPLPGNMTVIINGEVQGQKKDSLSGINFTLLDSKGKPLTLTKASDTGVRAGSAREVELVFQSKEQAPTKFIYSGRRTALVEVPFTLKDVPLP